MELNPYVGPFLLNNGFEKREDNNYYNSEYTVYTNPNCTVIVTGDQYQVIFDYPEVGEVSTYTDSLSMYHLVGILTWYDLIDRNYKK